jgi:ribosomal protein L31E
MKQPDLNKVLIGTHLNTELWKHGIKNPHAK